MIDDSRAQGLDITTEVYPYTAWSTFIGASIFAGEWTAAQEMRYEDIELPSTGERLNAQRFRELRETAPDTIIVGPGMKQDNVTRAVPSTGYRYVLVNGQFIVRDGAYQESSYPGRAVRR